MYPPPPPTEPKPKRPTFLTVLCILTFVSSGFATVTGLFGLLALGSATENMEMAADLYYEMAEEFDGVGEEMVLSAADYMMMLAPSAATMQIANFLLAALSLVGALMMFRLKKVGFHIYTAANVFALIVPLVLIGMHPIVMLSVIGGGIFTVLFIILYALNLKHMS